jgi:FixJ family two-component response regulator
MPSRPPLVLVAHDDEAMRNALQFVLRLEGVEVHTHDGGADLLADAELARAGCLILNHRMPCMDAFELLNSLREREIRLPVILLSGDARGGLRMRAKAAGVALVLEKPILDNTLVDGVMTILGAPAEPAIIRRIP